MVESAFVTKKTPSKTDPDLFLRLGDATVSLLPLVLRFIAGDMVLDHCNTRMGK
jgi:hypothetical protein